MKQAIYIQELIPILVVDGIGSALAGIGIAEWMGVLHMVPSALKFENYAMVMVAAGFLLCFSVTLYFLRRSARRTGE